MGRKPKKQEVLDLPDKIIIDEITTYIYINATSNNIIFFRRNKKIPPIN